MKRSMIIFVGTICVGIAFWAGRLTVSANPADNAAAINADGILAYQHYYECAENILKDVNITNAALAKDYAQAKNDLEDYKDGHILTWPEVCDQRDMLSDIIRKYADEENRNIMNYVNEYFTDPSILKHWAYRY